MNSDQNLVHSSTTLSTVVGVTQEVDRRVRALLTTPIHRRLAVACYIKRISAFSIHRILCSRATGYDKKCKCCAEHQANQLTDQLAIINRRRGKWPRGLQSGFALHLVFLFFDDLCQTNYINIYQTDLHRICRDGKTMAVHRVK